MKKRTVFTIITVIAAVITMVLWMKLTTRPFNPEEKYFFLFPLFFGEVILYAGLISNIYIAAGIAIPVVGIPLLVVYLPQGIFVNGRVIIAPGLMILFLMLLSGAWIFWFTAGRVIYRNRSITGDVYDAVLLSTKQTGESIRMSGNFPVYKCMLLFEYTDRDNSVKKTGAVEYLSETEIAGMKTGDIYKIIVDKKNRAKLKI